MKLAYFDCFSGISGDMTLGAFINAGLSLSHLRSELRKLNLDGYKISASQVKRCGLTATKVKVHISRPNYNEHRHYPDIVEIIAESELGALVKEKALSIFESIAKVEAMVHVQPIEKVHFHEVGAIDSIVDIVGAAICFVELGIDEIWASPVNTGTGTIVTEHGVLPTPAPATAYLLQGIPTYSEGPHNELTTPTGASILKAMAKGFGPQPAMTVNSIGHGAGGYDFPDRPNILRVFIGDQERSTTLEKLLELETNIDDMNPQVYEVLSGLLFKAGALDVTLVPCSDEKGETGDIVASPKPALQTRQARGYYLR